MSRTAARVTQADIARALRAVEQVGLPMAIEILTDGTIRLVPSSQSLAGKVAKPELIVL